MRWFEGFLKAKLNLMSVKGDPIREIQKRPVKLTLFIDAYIFKPKCGIF